MARTERDIIEARIARRLTANWRAIRDAKVTPLDVAKDIVAALETTRTLPAHPAEAEPRHALDVEIARVLDLSYLELPTGIYVDREDVLDILGAALPAEAEPPEQDPKP